MKRVVFEDEEEFHRASILHGQYLEEKGVDTEPRLEMHLYDGEESEEMAKRFDSNGIRFHFTDARI